MSTKESGFGGEGVEQAGEAAFSDDALGVESAPLTPEALKVSADAPATEAETQATWHASLSEDQREWLDNKGMLAADPATAIAALAQSYQQAEGKVTDQANLVRQYEDIIAGLSQQEQPQGPQTADPMAEVNQMLANVVRAAEDGEITEMQGMTYIAQTIAQTFPSMVDQKVSEKLAEIERTTLGPMKERQTRAMHTSAASSLRREMGGETFDELKGRADEIMRELVEDAPGLIENEALLRRSFSMAMGEKAVTDARSQRARTLEGGAPGVVGRTAQQEVDQIWADIAKAAESGGSGF